MNQLVPLSSRSVPIHALVAASGDRAQERFIEFFTANIRNRNTRRAYAQAVVEFLTWCEAPSFASSAPGAEDDRRLSARRARDETSLAG
jgi:beta-lactamase regulating signal transducer with metallopeptidase domain